jgi:transposase
MKKEVKFYTDEFKLQLIQEYLNSDLSQLELLKKYKIGGGSNISNWMRKFGIDFPNKPENFPRVMKPSKSGNTSEGKDLKDQIEDLRRQLEHEKLRTLALNTLIDVAERDLKISIRKKPGAKQ